MDPFGFGDTLAQYTMRNWMVFMGEFKLLVEHLDKIAAETDVNGVTADFIATEGDYDVANGEVAVWGGYDTNDVRRLGALANALTAWLDSNTSAILANGSTETRTRRQMVKRFYGPYQG